MNIQIGRAAWSAALLCALVACSDDAKSESGCADAGTVMACTCEDDSAGAQICQEDGGLSACSCGQTGGGTGGSNSGGSGGTGSDDEDGGVSGSGGNGSVDGGAGDGGTLSDGGETDGGTIAPPLPTDGDQLALCETGTDCNMGYECYTTGGGKDFCTKTCDMSDDCQGLAGSDSYTCSNNGLCEIECDPQDANSCPERFVCLQVGGAGPIGSQYRCKYSQNAGEGDGAAFSKCNVEAECNDGLDCVGADSLSSNPGYCSHACNDIGDCTEQPSSGSAQVLCATSVFPPVPGSESCVLDCSGDADGCPDAMACTFSRCEYP